MSLRVAVGIVALVCGSICGMTATFKMLGMVDQVNDRLPKEERFDPLGWYLSKSQRLHREYKRLYPDGRLLLQYYVACVWGLFVCSFASGVLDFLQSERLVANWILPKLMPNRNSHQLSVSLLVVRGFPNIYPDTTCTRYRPTSWLLDTPPYRI